MLWWSVLLLEEIILVFDEKKWQKRLWPLEKNYDLYKKNMIEIYMIIRAIYKVRSE